MAAIDYEQGRVLTALRDGGEGTGRMIEITTEGQEDIRLRLVPGLVLAFDWQTGDFTLAVPSWELAQTMTEVYYKAAGKRADAVLVRIDRVDGTSSPGVVQMTAQRHRGLKHSQVPKSDRNIPLPKRVAERLNQILLDSMPELGRATDNGNSQDSD